MNKRDESKLREILWQNLFSVVREVASEDKEVKKFLGHPAKYRHVIDEAEARIKDWHKDLA